MKVILYVGGLLGLTLLIVLVAHSDLPGTLRTVDLGGWGLFWLVPSRLLFFLLYAISWQALLRPYDPQRRVGIGYLVWATTVREAVDRLLPVASVGGAVIGVRLLRWRGIGVGPAGASVIVEIFLTLVALWLFTVMGVWLLATYHFGSTPDHHLLPAIFLGLAVPVLLGISLRYGSLFRRLEGGLRRLTGLRDLAQDAAALDNELRASLRRTRPMLGSCLAQLAAMASGSLEVWLVLRLLDHPVDLKAALIMESLMQAARHLAFLIPGGLGIQEIALMVVGNVLGVSRELALLLSLAKRMRELLCGLPALISWQWVEGHRLRLPTRS